LPRGSPVTKHKLLPYAETTEDAYGEETAKSFSIIELPHGGLLLCGPCPRCHATIEVPVVSTIFKSPRSLLDKLRPHSSTALTTGRDHTEPMMCICTDEHPDRPEGRAGCGAYWTLTIMASANAI
jgi:hypothetical protein